MNIPAGKVHHCQTGRDKRDAFCMIMNNQGDSLYPDSVCQECRIRKEYSGNTSMVPGMKAFILGAA